MWRIYGEKEVSLNKFEYVSYYRNDKTSVVTNRVKGARIKRDRKEKTHGHIIPSGYKWFKGYGFNAGNKVVNSRTK